MNKIVVLIIVKLWGLLVGMSLAEDRPNILWITGEDMSATWLGCYGNETSKTPTFDQLAEEGFLYTHCFAHTPVCAPARSGWITGAHPVSNGTIYMRSTHALPESVAWYPDVLRASGYFVSNHSKTDYNTSNRNEGWLREKGKGSCGHYSNTWDNYERYGWRSPERKVGQPFFHVFNNAGCHESYLHQSKNKNGSYNPADMKLAAYHPDIPKIRMDYARYSNGVAGADRVLKQVLEALKKDGLEDETIVIYTSDHGGIIGRSKRFLYDSGSRVAHIVRIPEKYKHLWPSEKPGDRIDRLVSFIDMPKTWLAIAGCDIPVTMQGSVYLGKNQDAPRDHVFMARQRMDTTVDMQRAIRDGQFLYIRNYEPFRPNGQYLPYLWKAPSMRAWEAHHLAGKTDEITGAFFRPKPVEQLFDCAADPDNVNNLAHEPNQQERVKRMRSLLRERQLLVRDCGFLPEGVLEERCRKHGTTIHDLLRDPQKYDQAAYMKAADVANFATSADLPTIVQYLKSPDEGLRYWGVIGCIGLGSAAATDEVLRIMEDLVISDIQQVSSLDVRANAALYLAMMNHDKQQALESLVDVITAEPKPTAAMRAYSNATLLGGDAADLVPMLKRKVPSLNDELKRLVSRIELE